jgi:hypothetical protein
VSVKYWDINDKGRSKARWKDDVENDVRKMGIVKWRQVGKDNRGEWWRASREKLILLDSGAAEEENE